jgi:hypothetical protein
MVVAESTLAKSLKEQILERTNHIEPIELVLGEATMKGAQDFNYFAEQINRLLENSD